MQLENKTLFKKQTLEIASKNMKCLAISPMRDVHILCRKNHKTPLKGIYRIK